MVGGATRSLLLQAWVTFFRLVRLHRHCAAQRLWRLATIVGGKCVGISTGVTAWDSRASVKAGPVRQAIIVLRVISDDTAPRPSGNPRITTHVARTRGILESI